MRSTLFPGSLESACTRSSGNSVDLIDDNLFVVPRSEEHTSELQSRVDLVCRLLLVKKSEHDVVEQQLQPFGHPCGPVEPCVQRSIAVFERWRSPNWIGRESEVTAGSVDAETRSLIG